MKLREVAKSLCGIDIEKKLINLVRQELGIQDIFSGNAEALEEIPFEGIFEVILVGDLIEHLSSPGCMLESVKRFMSSHSELIITTPDVLRLMANLRVNLGIFNESPAHICAFSIYTLANLLNRHGFTICEAYTGFDHPAQSVKQKAFYRIGSMYFKLFPAQGGGH